LEFDESHDGPLEAVGKLPFGTSTTDVFEFRRGETDGTELFPERIIFDMMLVVIQLDVPSYSDNEPDVSH